MAPRWSWSSTEGDCRADSAEAISGCDLGVEAEDRPPSQASSWSWASNRLEDEGSIVAKETEAWTQLATRIPKDLHRRLKLYCVTNDIALMQFVVEAIDETLGRTAKAQKRTT
jgi:hypothetical protein